LLGDVGCFSFYPVKHLTTGEGGMLITRREDVAKSISCLRAFGIDRNLVAERKEPGQYDVQHLGLNYRLNEIGAAMGLAQMEKLPWFLEKRQENFAALSTGLAEIPGITLFDPPAETDVSSHYCLSMRLNDELAARRGQIIEQLKQCGIGTSVYYPKPVPVMTYYKQKYGHAAADFPVAASISEQSIALPVGPHIDLDDVAYMVETIRHTLEETQR
jgi:dTDP-4-amino-4,6-dideoxygalactose transaminase